MVEKKVFWCTSCLNMSTRNRIQFDEKGRCNACTWVEKKKSIDWESRNAELVPFLDKFRSKDGGFDCIVTCSGGKDGSFVAYNLKHKYGMNPLAITVRPALALGLGDKNLYNFIHSGYTHLHVTPDPKAMQLLNKHGFIEHGFPYFGWLTALSTAVIRIAQNFNVPLIFFGENGEVEYGGSTENMNQPIFDIEYIKRIGLEGGYDKVLNKAVKEGNLSQNDLYFFKYPSDEDAKKKPVSFTYYSYFDNWDPYRNYLVAKEHCGLEEREEANSATFTNFAQNDQALYSLHAYLMYLKFGFGRATQDAGIEIRRGAMTRDQALNLVKIYDNMYPYEHISAYLEYYKMSQNEFDTVLDRWANRELFEKIDGIWSPKFIIGEDFVI